MQRLACDPLEPDERILVRAAEILASGGVAAVPTETFYGLAADAEHPGAVARVNLLKGKPGAPVLLLAADLEQVARLVSRMPSGFAELAARFWPGPLTLILPAANGTTVAVRIPAHAIPRGIASRLGRPITGPSANRHGQEPCSTPERVAQVFGDELDLLIDAGATAGGPPSTLLDLSGPQPVLLRKGVVPRSQLARWLA